MNKIDELKEQGRSIDEIAEQLKRNKPTLEEEDDDEEDVMEDDLEVGDIRLGEEGYFDDFGASTSHQPVEAEGSQASKADGMDEYGDLEVGDVRASRSSQGGARSCRRARRIRRY
ncbi:hypothetical protein B9Z55_027966 [Caenorhabditis nigoni]|uniref:Uncharacterized protein n=1 Tax=Caenorhabditis nigoni TaxID=1611254 RepID=A0A2G5SDJ1_9PELO|nr:hypothetical protein B9Z55_027966 [Caenorhabditis nigoni]